MKKWFLGGFALLAVIGAASGGGSSTSTSSSSNDESATKVEASASGKKSAKKADNAGCGKTATDDCTPRVAWNDGYVRVDALLWKVNSVETTKAIGDMQYGLGQKADGRFVVAKLKVRSKKDESATLTDNAMKLQIGDTTYDPDTEGTVAAIGDGQEPFFLRDLGPDSSTTGTVVFDVPESKIGKKMELRFGELGFGQTHALVQLPERGA